MRQLLLLLALAAATFAAPLTGNKITEDGTYTVTTIPGARYVFAVSGDFGSGNLAINWNDGTTSTAYANSPATAAETWTFTAASKTLEFVLSDSTDPDLTVTVSETGADSGGPSTIDNTNLNAAIAEDPEATKAALELGDAADMDAEDIRAAANYQFVNVMDYGAVADGTGNNDAAITAAVAAAQAVGKAVFFPPGNYRVTSEIYLTGDNIVLYGTYGESIITSTITTGPCIRLGTKLEGPCGDFRVYDLQFNGPGRATSSVGIEHCGLPAGNCYMFRPYFTNFGIGFRTHDQTEGRIDRGRAIDCALGFALGYKSDGWTIHSLKTHDCNVALEIGYWHPEIDAAWTYNQAQCAGVSVIAPMINCSGAVTNGVGIVVGGNNTTGVKISGSLQESMLHGIQIGHNPAVYTDARQQENFPIEAVEVVDSHLRDGTGISIYYPVRQLFTKGLLNGDIVSRNATSDASTIIGEFAHTSSTGLATYSRWGVLRSSVFSGLLRDSVAMDSETSAGFSMKSPTTSGPFLFDLERVDQARWKAYINGGGGNTLIWQPYATGSNNPANTQMRWANSAGTQQFLMSTSTGNFTAAGNLVCSTAGRGLTLQSGANALAGNATLVAGSVLVSNTAVGANSVITLTRKTPGGTVGDLSYSIVNGSSFTITSASATDTSVVSYFILQVN